MLADIIWDKETLATVMALSIPIIAILAGAWSHVERTRSANDLKRAMVERGMSVDDMERVMSIRMKSKS